jgi:NAD(P)-dependent dehydrogenase (short-subunit alcohol dehydrogenase family)
MMFGTGKAAIVSGVGPGMGRRPALGLARGGMDVVLHRRRPRVMVGHPLLKIVDRPSPDKAAQDAGMFAGIQAIGAIQEKGSRCPT